MRRLLFERSSYASATVKGFGRDKQFMATEGHSDCSVWSGCSMYANFVVFLMKQRQSRIPITNETRE